MTDASIIALATAIAQLGVATAAYRLGSALKVRQENHEKDDKQFQTEVRQALHIKAA